MEHTGVGAQNVTMLQPCAPPQTKEQIWALLLDSCPSTALPSTFLVMALWACAGRHRDSTCGCAILEELQAPSDAASMTKYLWQNSDCFPTLINVAHCLIWQSFYAGCPLWCNLSQIYPCLGPARINGGVKKIDLH